MNNYNNYNNGKENAYQKNSSNGVYSVNDFHKPTKHQKQKFVFVPEYSEDERKAAKEQAKQAVLNQSMSINQDDWNGCDTPERFFYYFIWGIIWSVAGGLFFAALVWILADLFRVSPIGGRLVLFGLTLPLVIFIFFKAGLPLLKSTVRRVHDLGWNSYRTVIFPSILGFLATTGQLVYDMLSFLFLARAIEIIGILILLLLLIGSQTWLFYQHIVFSYIQDQHENEEQKRKNWNTEAIRLRIVLITSAVLGILSLSSRSISRALDFVIDIVYVIISIPLGCWSLILLFSCLFRLRKTDYSRFTQKATQRNENYACINDEKIEEKEAIKITSEIAHIPLISKGTAPANPLTTKHSASLLHFAVESNNIELVTTLIQAGADVNKKDSNGHTPLHLAVYFGKKEIMKLLLEAGADVNIDGDYKKAIATQEIKVS